MKRRFATRIRYYVLDGHAAVAATAMEWVVWFETADRIVGRTRIGQWNVSTVFIGLDRNYFADGPPLLFETMIFSPDVRGGHDWQSRCSTWAEAEVMHLAACTHVRTQKMELT